MTSGTTIRPAADPVGNVVFDTAGTLGFSLLVEPDSAAADLQVGLAIDDFGDDTMLGSTTEQSTLKDVAADGLWHEYEWALDDATFSSAFGAAGDGVLGTRFSLDSLLFQGFADATVYLSNVFFNASGTVPIPEPTSTLAVLGLAGVAVLGRRAPGSREP